MARHSVRVKILNHKVNVREVDIQSKSEIFPSIFCITQAKLTLKLEAEDGQRYEYFGDLVTLLRKIMHWTDSRDLDQIDGKWLALVFSGYNIIGIENAA